ncbi:hypothetical protein [Lignipirellula cremea]|uniref:Uncharacterized protein n=1 Tax=Lignipirellula cremea TaxID=2528010 RepID=A0A518DN48_9BACT|nr:hypothetical protein [Lignipirellula cremea]QDU93252.1 hypothetical protein Pla8534_10310 [Lignipirellula cremea]
MALLDLLNPWRGRRQLTELSEKLACDCRHQVWQRIVNRAGGMSPAESRGYIRARAAVVVKREVLRAVQNEQFSAPTLQRLQQLTSDAVLRLISTQLHMLQPATAPLRRAA